MAGRDSWSPISLGGYRIPSPTESDEESYDYSGAFNDDSIFNPVPESQTPPPPEPDTSASPPTFPLTGQKLTHPVRTANNHIELHEGDIFLEKYQVLAGHKLGDGTFSRVFHVYDSTGRNHCAMKIVRNEEQYKTAALKEIDIHQKLLNATLGNSTPIIKLLGCCYFGGHVCLKFPRMTIDGFQYIEHLSSLSVQHERNEVIPVIHFKHIAYQLCRAVAFLHNLDIVHTDIKTENFMFSNLARYKKLYRSTPLQYSEVKLIDLGSAQDISRRRMDPSETITSYHCRAPEVILRKPRSKPIDMFSLGCTFFELYTKLPLFSVEHESPKNLTAQLALMEDISGKFKEELTYGNSFYFTRGGAVKYHRLTKKTKEDFLDRNASVPPYIFDFIKALIEIDPVKRLTAEQAVNHGFWRAGEAQERLMHRILSEDRDHMKREANRRAQDQTAGRVEESRAAVRPSTAPRSRSPIGRMVTRSSAMRMRNPERIAVMDYWNGGLSQTRRVPNAHKRRLYVGNLAPETTKEEIKLRLQMFGPIDDVVIKHDSIHNGMPCSYAFITFRMEGSITSVFSYGDIVFKQRTLVLRRYRPNYAVSLTTARQANHCECCKNKSMKVNKWTQTESLQVPPPLFQSSPSNHVFGMYGHFASMNGGPPVPPRAEMSYTQQSSSPAMAHFQGILSAPSISSLDERFYGIMIE
ncbi:hypothetical protein QR680_000200 [Steinernema hermaphroditum]|uniref:Protein kinase domain-containing protein n=1 Tax=Steinernema hermaphroditum TaxID=289476 RepID=A0AA39GTR8_9BILA|nr:hypothetical protein QR680_000200 [Steinernema hermaphroditum]